MTGGSSVEVVRLGGGSCSEGRDAGGFHRDHSVEILEDSVDDEEGLAEDFEFVAVERVGGDDGVHDSRFVFHAEEDEAVGGAGTLADDDCSGDADELAVADSGEVDGALDAEGGHFGAAVGHGVAAYGEAGAAIVGPEALFGVHAGEGRGGSAFFEVLEKGANRESGALRLPEGVAAVELVEAVEGADFGEAGEFVFAELGDAKGEVVDAGEGAGFAGAEDGAGGLFAESFGIAQTEAEMALGGDRAVPIGLEDVDGEDAEAVALGVFDEDRWGVEAHRLIVEHRAGEGGEVAAFQVGAGVGEEREAGGVRLGEAVERERSDGVHDGVL